MRAHLAKAIESGYMPMRTYRHYLSRPPYKKRPALSKAFAGGLANCIAKVAYGTGAEYQDDQFDVTNSTLFDWFSKKKCDETQHSFLIKIRSEAAGGAGNKATE